MHAASSTPAQKNISLTLTSPRQRSGWNQGYGFAIDETCFCKQTVLKGVLFDAGGVVGGWACDQVDQSRSSFSSYIPNLCLSLTDSVNDEFHINSVNVVKTETLSVYKTKSLCKHYLLSAQYRFSICNKPLSHVYCEFFKSYFNIIA